MCVCMCVYASFIDAISKSDQSFLNQTETKLIVTPAQPWIIMRIVLNIFQWSFDDGWSTLLHYDKFHNSLSIRIWFDIEFQIQEFKLAEFDAITTESLSL